MRSWHGFDVWQVVVGRLPQDGRYVHVRVDGRTLGMRLHGLLREQEALTATSTAALTTAAATANDAVRHAVWSWHRLDVWQVVGKRIQQDGRAVHVRVDGGPMGVRLHGLLRAQVALAATAAAAVASTAAPADDDLRHPLWSRDGEHLRQVVR